MTMRWIYLDVNPEPWAVGPLALGRKSGKMFPKMERNASVHSFKEAVRDELAALGDIMLPEGKYELDFYFWRRLDSYVGESGRKANAHVADATNMQKSLEDALQGILFGNDRDVVRIQSTVVEQGADVVPGIVVRAESATDESIPWEAFNIRGLALEEAADVAPEANVWPPVGLT